MLKFLCAFQKDKQWKVENFHFTHYGYIDSRTRCVLNQHLTQTHDFLHVFYLVPWYSIMPGHVKKSDGPDPDPSPWLIVSDELKVKLKAKPYDAKKSCWVPDKATGGYNEGLIESADGEKVSVQILGGDVKVFKKDQVGQVNPPKFDCSEDMAGEHL